MRGEFVENSRKKATEEVAKLHLEELDLEERKKRGGVALFVVAGTVLLLLFSGVVSVDLKSQNIAFHWEVLKDLLSVYSS